MMIVTHEWSAAVTGGSDDIISIMYHRHRHRLSSSLLPEAFVQVHDCLKNPLLSMAPNFKDAFDVTIMTIAIVLFVT